MNQKRAAISFSRSIFGPNLARLALAVVLFCAPRVANAAADVVLLTADEEKSAPVVELESQLGAALRAQFHELDLRLLVFPGTRSALALNARRAREVATNNDALAVIWIASNAAGIDVFLYDSRGRHLYSRRVPATASSAATSEEVALVLRSAIGAVLEGNAALSMTEVALPPPRPPESAPSASLPPRPVVDSGEIRLGAGYVGEPFTRSASWQHGVTLSVSVHAPQAPWLLGLSYDYFPALAVNSQGVQTRIRRHPGEIFGGAELRWHRLWFIAEGALSADNVVRTTTSAGQGLSASADSKRWLWALSTRLGGAVNFTPSVRCTLKLGAEFLLNPYDQVIAAQGASNEVVAAPLRARPRAELVVSIGL